METIPVTEIGDAVIVVLMILFILLQAGVLDVLEPVAHCLERKWRGVPILHVRFLDGVPVSAEVTIVWSCEDLSYSRNNVADFEHVALVVRYHNKGMLDVQAKFGEEVLVSPLWDVSNPRHTVEYGRFKHLLLVCPSREHAESFSESFGLSEILGTEQLPDKVKP